MQLSSKPAATNASPSPATITLDVTGMKCAGCVKAVEDQLGQLPGVVAASVNLVTETALVEYQVGVVDPGTMAQTLTEGGFPSQVRQSERSDNETDPQPNPLEEQRQREAKRQTQRLVMAAILLFLSALGHLGQWGWMSLPGLSNIWFHAGLATIALIGPGLPILVDGWRGLKRGSPNMNTLVSLGTLSAYWASVAALLIPRLGWECFFDEPVMLVGFILLGRLLEQRARNRAVASFQALVALQPRIARRVQPQTDPTTWDETATQVPIERVQVGEWLQVLPGDRIPVDGSVVMGQTLVDESMLTGESMPVLKRTGDLVAAGTLNQSGAIVLQATRTGKDTTLAQIIALVETAQTRKAPIQHLADTIAGYFAYGVMTISTLTFAFWYWVGTSLWPQVLEPIAGMVGHDHGMAMMESPALLSLKLAIAVMVIACPCALGLATPTAILVGSSMGAERGLLIRGGDVLEKIHAIDTVVFDKTGTLTQGNPVVTDCVSLNPQFSSDQLLQLAATVEQGTCHPLAEAIQTKALQQGLSLLPAYDFQTEPGLGVSGIVQMDDRPQRVILGNSDWLHQQEITFDSDTQSQVEWLASGGKSLVYAAIEGQFIGLLAVTDPLKPDALETVTGLRQMGLRVMLLTGDRQAVAIQIGKSLNLAPDDILAEVRPEEKAQTIARLQSAGHRIAMIGDGINDAPALAQADVSLSFHTGTDVAIETAEVILMRHPLTDVLAAIRLSQATFQKIRQNLFWAFAYNVMGIPVAAGALLPTTGIMLSPAVAGALMAFSSISVVLNSLLLRRSSQG
ncbi:MAG: heavy metal translocating P-type ATPase [Leptolyngbyaceae cyanobacterium bins.59]|nr:heavy metal translocating P-type ATPase [Leptolyngbyaceae cyanobacterium bins.59]